MIVTPPLMRSVAEQHVQDVVALLAAAGGLGSRPGLERGMVGWCDAIAVDHPVALLDAVGGQSLRLGWGSGLAVHDVAGGGKARSAEQAETQNQSYRGEGLLHGLLHSLQRLLTRRRMPSRHPERAEVLR